MSLKVLQCLAVLSQINFLLADPIVRLPNGFIRGREDITLENKTYYSFLEIPYAAAPTGKLRFKPPQPAVDWQGVRDGTRIGTICFQSANSDNESEDCLFVNVFTPQLPNDDHNVSLPVMFWIHGGGFVSDSAVRYAPDLFVNQDVVFVSINYRLGVFGFLSTEDDVIPGNNGLKDQQFAIEWTHNNIHLFGGDPNQITIFGESAGSASCAYQLLNPRNEGLFRAAILQSGSSLSPWAFQRRARNIAFTTASYINSSFEDSDDSQALLDFLMSLDARDIDAAAGKYRDTEGGPPNVEILQGFFYAPVVEVDHPGAFLTRKMYGLLQSGDFVQVPILIGMTSEESLTFNLMTTTLYDQHLDWIVPNDMRIADETARTHMGALIREMYTNGEPMAQHLGAFVRYSSDNSFTRSIIKHAEFHSKFAETYFYVFSHDGELFPIDIHYDGAGRVGHGAELLYLFCSGTRCDVSAYPRSDDLTRRRLVKLWTDFAKYREPTPGPSDLLQNISWPVVSNGDLLYLDVNEYLEIRKNPRWKTYQGWNKLYDGLGYDDFDTY